MSEHPIDRLRDALSWKRDLCSKQTGETDCPGCDEESAALHAVEQLERLLSRFREWDALNPPPDPIPAPFADLPFWIAEIDRTLALFDRKEQTP